MNENSNPNPNPSPSFDDQIEKMREGFKMVADLARPSLAESLKLAHGALRTLDSAVAGGLRKVGERREVAGLYVIVDPEHCNGRDPILVASKALDGGAAIIQWRDKQRDKGDQLPIVRALRDLCSRHMALLIVNDHADLALAAKADGVHVGQHDLPVAELRKIVPTEFIIGCSTNNPHEAQRAEQDGASYIAVGSIFPTSTKENTREASPETIREIRQVVTLPLIAIGGITPENLEQVIAAGADGAAVISAICAADDVEGVALHFSRRFWIEHEKRSQAGQQGQA